MTTPLPGPAPVVDVQSQPTQANLTIGQIILILAAGLTVKATLDHLVSAMAGTGVGRQALIAAWRAGKFGLRHRGVGPQRVTYGAVTVRVAVSKAAPARAPAVLADQQQEAIYRAAYLLASSRRIQDARDQAVLHGEDPDVAVRLAAEREARFYTAHEQAVTDRRRSAQVVDRTARGQGAVGIDPITGLPSLMVGWHAINDAKTSPECRAADGHAFPISRVPLIGWPGAVHPHCRCTAGPAHPGMPLLDGSGYFWPA